MEVSTLQLPPGDPGLIDKIVCQLKSNGIFDQFRKECIADVDTKPAYQNLRQRVEGSVSSFLSDQEWKPDLNKNQLRDSLRKNIHESGFLDIGVERIVDQVVNPKIYTVFFPKVEDVVYGFLGVEKPKKGIDLSNGLREDVTKFNDSPNQEKKFVSLKDLLPTDLDPISPEKFDSDEDIEENSPNKVRASGISVVDQNDSQKLKVKEEIASDTEHYHDDDERDDEDDDDDEDSPPFESLENDALEPNISPPLPPHLSTDNLDGTNSSSSETKDISQNGETKKRNHDVKLDSIKVEVNGETEKYALSTTIKTETASENFSVKKEEKEKKESFEAGKDSKKYDRKEDKNRDTSERKGEIHGKKSSDTKDKHGHEKKRSDRDLSISKSEKDDGKKEDQRKTSKDEHRKSDKDEHKKSEKDEHRKGERDEHKKGNKEDHRKSERSNHKRTDKDEHRKSEKEETKRDEVKKSEKGDKKHGEKIDKDRDSSRRHDREKEDRKCSTEKEKKHVREKEENKRSEKDDYRKSEKEKDDRSKTERERSDSKKKDKRDEKKSEKEEKKVSKEKDEIKKSDKEDTKRPEKEEYKKLDRDKDKYRSSKEKAEHSKIDKETKEQVRCEGSNKEVKHGSSKPGTESTKKESERDHTSKLQGEKKKEDKSKKYHHPESSKSNSSKDRKSADKDKKASTSDDHRHDKVKGKDGHRRSDRDKDRERERSQADNTATTHTSLNKDGSGHTSSTSSTPSSEGSKGNGDSSSGSGGSERAKEGDTKVKNIEEKEDIKINEIYSPISKSPGNLAMKIKKPKIAANIYEVKKIIQVRKNLKKLERERMASSSVNKAPCNKSDEASSESASKLEDLSESEATPEPPKVKRAKLGAVEQDLRVEVESVLEKGLLDDEEGDIGEVHHLENDSNLNDFVLYVRGLEEEAAMGDYSRIPSPANSIITAELSDFEDNVILSDVELSKEEEDIVTKLGGLVERKMTNTKSTKKMSGPLSSLEISSEGCNKRPRRPNPRYSGGEFTVYSDDDDDGGVDDDMIETVPHKKESLVDGVEIEQTKTPKEKESAYDDADALGNGAALPTPENDEDRETPALSKRNQAAAEERRKFGKRLGVRGPLRRFAGFSPGTPDNFVMPLSPESDVSTASGDAGKKASLNTKALENQYHQDVDGELVPEDFDDVKASEDVDKHSRLPLGPPMSADVRSQTSELHHVHNDMGQSSSVLMEGDKRIDDQSGLVSRRLRGTRSSVRVQQRYSSDDLYKPRPNITLGRRNRGRNSPTQDESSTTDNAFLKQGRRGSSQGTEELLTESCTPNKRRRR